jgi:EAL domain-containing protein (putative c-di-GMP-specific phosphodiesterase class I)
LPEIEDHPLAIELGEWVIDSALTQLELWRNEGLDIQVSVNIGARQLKQDNFIRRLREILATHPDIMPSYLELEVLETSALEDITKASLLIDDCRMLGISFALDDFGTGYSSLTYLKRLPVALLKIDQSFVRDMLNDTDDLAIIKGIIDLARTFRREVIAEGVETAEHGALLLKLGCDLAQGYGVARPMPADQFHKWSTTWRLDPVWVDQSSMNHNELPMLFASVEQRAWVAAIEAFLKGERDEPMALDTYHSRLSMWMDTEILAKHSTQSSFAAINSLHQKILSLSTELCELHTLGKNSEALARLGELHDLGDALIQQLKVPAQKT